jgi:hypothetical protein
VPEQLRYHSAWLESIMSKDKDQEQTPHRAAVEAARLNPNGWVYKIDTRYGYGPDDDVPLKAIVGWWSVGEKGQISGVFVPNREYQEPM